MTRSFAAPVLLALLASLPSGCTFIAAKQQQTAIDATCQISGRVSIARKDSYPIVVVLVRREEGQERPWRVADYFVMEEPGRWAFGAPPGRFAVVAFQDRGRDLVYSPGEAYATAAADNPLACAAGGRFTDIAIAIPEKADKPLAGTFDIPKLQRRDATGQLESTLGQLTKV